jgi:hypothetical protein
MIFNIRFSVFIFQNVVFSTFTQQSGVGLRTLLVSAAYVALHNLRYLI